MGLIHAAGSAVSGLGARLYARIAVHGRDRGDVPGWVLVTVMTAGMVAVIWGVAEDQLVSMLTSALNQVR